MTVTLTNKIKREDLQMVREVREVRVEVGGGRVEFRSHESDLVAINM